MNKLIEQLVSVLEKELETHLRLIKAAHDMNEAVKGNSIDTIQSAGRMYDTCITTIADMEEKRLALSDAICGGTPGGAPHASLLRVIERVPPEHKKTIIDLRTKLKEEIDKLSKINYANQVLLTESLSTIQKTFDMIATEHDSRLAGYKKQGKKDNPRSTITIVNTTA